ncbi:MAG: AI-2E family transporter [Firmicutes bacterium]|nr:AI-2E family transporter [Bacillota bacterium]
MAWWREKKYYRIALLILLLAMGIYFLFLVRGIFLSFLLAVTLTYVLNPVVSAMEAKGTPRVIAILILYAVLIIISTSLILYGMPHIIKQLNQMVNVVPEYTEQVKEFSQSIQKQYAQAGIPESIRNVIDERISWIEETLLELAQRTVEGLTGIAGYIFNIVLAPILAFYLLKDVELFKEKVVKAIPFWAREDMLILGSDVHQVLNRFIRGYMTVSLIVGGLTWLSMSILGVEFPIMLGLFAGLTQIIPYFGPVMGALPAIALGLLTSKWLALKVIIAFFVIQQLEGNILSPKILGDQVGLHPLFVILVLLAGGQLFGLMGMILAVPVSAMLKVILYFSLRKLLPESHGQV